MRDYDLATYGDRIADDYDRLHAHLDPTAAVDTLAELAGGGAVLELGIGTGRIALPLAARGVAVSGVDASAAMIEKLRAKPGGQGIAVHAGDFAEVPAPGPFSVIFVAFNTFFVLESQDAQVRCFENAAARLSPHMHDFFAANASDIAYEAYFNLPISQGDTQSLILPGTTSPNASAAYAALF